MTLCKVIFLTLCFLFSIDFAFCDSDNPLAVNETVLEMIRKALLEVVLRSNLTEGGMNASELTQTKRETFKHKITRCGLPEEAHRVVYMYGTKFTWGSVVNFTDPVNERLIEVDQFLGLPYAMPPNLFDERFAPPREARLWLGFNHNHEMEKGCIQQTNNRVPWAVQDDDKENLSEDCLYLNIWTPFNQSGIANKSSINEKPVLFFVHGGFFSTGSSRQEIYDGRVLAGLGDVVVVTVNYRLGAFGFWTTDKQSAPGNIALLDIHRAITFCRANIQYFGGDPERMTLAGQGAGAVAVSLLSLVHGYPRPWIRLILQSGSLINPFPAELEETLIHSYSLAVGVGCANDSYLPQEHPEEVGACMRNVDPFVLAEEESKMRLRPGPYTGFIPMWGTSQFPNNPYTDLLKGNHDIQEMMIGTTNFDGAFQIAASDPDRFGYYFEKDNVSIDADEAKRIFAGMFPYVNSSDVDEVFQIYSTSEEFSNVENDTWIPRLQLARAVTDLSFTCASLFFAEKAMAKKVKVYFYDFKFKPSDGNSPWPQWMRPTHFEEVQYVFGKPFLDAEKYSAEEIELSRSMIEMWTNFAKMLPTWPRLNVTQPMNDSFVINPEYLGTPSLEQCGIFHKYFGRSLL